MKCKYCGDHGAKAFVGGKRACNDCWIKLRRGKRNLGQDKRFRINAESRKHLNIIRGLKN